MHNVLLFAAFIAAVVIYISAISAGAFEKWGGSVMMSIGMCIALWPMVAWFVLFAGLFTGYNFAPDTATSLAVITKQYWNPYVGFWCLAGAVIADLRHFGRILKKLIGQRDRRNGPQAMS